MGSVITICKADLNAGHDFVEKEAMRFCLETKNDTHYLVFFPRPGSLLPLIKMLTQKQISYSLQFDDVTIRH